MIEPQSIRSEVMRRVDEAMKEVGVVEKILCVEKCTLIFTL